MSRNINSVQRFIRIFVFLVVCAIGGIILSIFYGVFQVIFHPNLAPVFAMIAIPVVFTVASIAAGMFFVLPEWNRIVLLRAGKFNAVKGPGFFIIPPFIYSVAAVVDVRILTHQVEATATLTKDNVPTRITAAIEFEVEDSKKAIINVQDYLSSVIWLATEALKNTIGSLDLRELLGSRDEVAMQLKAQIDSQAQIYGVNVRAVRITDIDTPPELIEELAVIARAERAARAKQIQAEAEVLVATKMAEAAEILSKQKGGFKLREIQNLSEISKEESSMIIIYPSDSSTGKQTAAAAVSLNKLNKKT